MDKAPTAIYLQQMIVGQYHALLSNPRHKYIHVGSAAASLLPTELESSAQYWLSDLMNNCHVDGGWRLIHPTIE